jgi:CBS domain-containing protein
LDQTALTDSHNTKSSGHTTATISRAKLRTEQVRALAHPHPATVASGTPLGEALREARGRGGDALLVIDATGALVGIFTEHDMLIRVLGRPVDQQRPIDEFMTPTPVTLPAHATLFEAMQVMQRGGYRNVPVLEADGKVVGVLRQIDVLGYVAEAFPEEILNLPPRPHQLMEEPEGA